MIIFQKGRSPSPLSYPVRRDNGKSRDTAATQQQYQHAAAPAARGKGG